MARLLKNFWVYSRQFSTSGSAGRYEAWDVPGYKAPGYSHKLVSDIPVPKRGAVDRWSLKRARYGENDFKDMLGDGSWRCKFNIRVGPPWMRGWRGTHRIQYCLRSLKIDGHKFGPAKKKQLKNEINYLFKKLNKHTRRTQYGEKVRYSDYT